MYAISYDKYVKQPYNVWWYLTKINILSFSTRKFWIKQVAVNTKWNTCWKKTNQSNFSFQMPSKFKTYFSSYLTSAKSSLHVNIDSWKIYLTTKEGRDKLLLQSIDKDGQHIRVYDYRLETPDDKSLKITICCVPLSVDVSAVFETLSKLKFLQK